MRATRERPEMEIHDGRFAERLRAVRIDQGWSQRQIAEALGKSVRSYSSWENEDVLPEMGETLQNLAALLRVRPGWLLNGQPDPRDDPRYQEDGRAHD